MQTLCIIPARGGSKRIPRKNIRPLRGRPLMAWTIQSAKVSGAFDTIMVSTDDPEIAAIAVEAGAVVPFLRSNGAASDHASTTEVMTEVLAAYRMREGKSFDAVCCLYPTSALLKPQRLREGAELLLGDATIDSAMAVQRYRHPIERAYRVNDGVVQQLSASQHAKRTQDIEAAYHDAGQFYWFRPDRFAVTGRLLGEKCAPVVLQTWEAVDLDNEDDWLFLERLAAQSEDTALQKGAA